jgi:hypothetical protein
MWGFDKTMHDEQNPLVGCILLPEADPMKWVDIRYRLLPPRHRKKKVPKMRISGVAKRIELSAGERNSMSVVLAAMLAALAAYPVIVHFGLPPSALRQYFEVLFRWPFTDTSGAFKDSPTARSARWLPKWFRVYNASDLSLIHSSPYRKAVSILVSIVVVPLAGVFADAWEDHHAIPCLDIGATLPVSRSAQSHALSPAASK